MIQQQIEHRVPLTIKIEPLPKQRMPEWIKVQAKASPNYSRVKNILEEHKLHSVCQEAACPNIRECFGEGTATFMILGNHCTRGCRFCNVKTAVPLGLDRDEPRRLAEVVAKLNLKQVVVTSVTRDDLPDGGAEIFADTIHELRRRDPKMKVEVLIPDLQGNAEAVDIVLAARPDVFAHNVETVGRLYRRVRPGAEQERSLDILRQADRYAARPVVKTGFMVGLGERREEIEELLRQILDTGCEIVTVGQYLRPSGVHLPVERFVHPDEFKEIAAYGHEIGFKHVEAGPLVRSSYKAFSQSKDIIEAKESLLEKKKNV
ncbi:MAG TPA: lipoyl synthase [candidate division Zixibacteria bacterium]|nr:lipoyl synthase [candidate division Zixibacteria bacterium]